MIYFTTILSVLLFALLILSLICSERRNNRRSEEIRDLKSRLSKAEEACREINHDLNLSLINEVSRIEQNIRSMDYSVKGVSNISNRVLTMKTLFYSLGYDIPELYLKPYNHSDNHQVTMKSDPSLNPGDVVVTKVIRPAVLFNGVMIQTANIVVSYNEN